MKIQNTDRILFVDWLRTSIILLLVPFHAALIYTGGKVYINDISSDYPEMLCFLIFFLYHFFMDLLFFVSGYSSYCSFQKRGLKKLLKERSKKLMLTFLFGVVVILPVCAYFMGVHHNGFQGNFITFYGEFFSRFARYFGWGQFWFLLYLFIISMIAVPVLSKFFGRGDDQKTKPIFIIIFFLMGHIVIEALLRPFFPGNLSIVGDYANLLSYSLSFSIGWLMRKKFLETVSRNWKKFLVLGIIAYIGLCSTFLNGLKGEFLFIKQLSVLKTGSGFKLEIIFFNVWTGFYCWSWILFCIGFGNRFLNKESKVFSFLSKYSFTFFVLHNIPVTIIAFYILHLNINPYLKWVLVTVGSFVLLFALLISMFYIKMKIKTINKMMV